MKDIHQTPQNQRNSSDSKAAGHLPQTWERFIPKQMADDSASRKLFKLHYGRYQIATRYVLGKQVLDIACGAGYGSQMLGQAGAKSVIGVDVCRQTVDYAQKNYQSPGVSFTCESAEEFTWPELFDVVISFETMEHLHQPAQFLGRLHSLLVPNGCLLLSVPLGETSHFDPYHLHAFSQKDVMALLENAGFEVESYRCDPCFLNCSELLHWGRLYPSSMPSAYEMLFTPNGWRIMQDFVFQGGFDVPQILVIARKKKFL
jgi:2-polyprenyl-3-methyl-5-hydroxy-6-metoxy-1,4-benzoquinol methylase